MVGGPAERRSAAPPAWQRLPPVVTSGPAGRPPARAS
ncbi:Atypical orf [Ralstonia solanacearum UW551]|uniref:Atypical orf n=1 Tax=Ralstonia solanacearum (strain UW551) TaxID=342110 RepID=A0AB33VC39_RALSU|nr:Atypical orf [Ralstonia solanacearum UW551]